MGKNTGVGRHSLLQGIFLTQGSNPGLLHCTQILHQLSHKGSLKLRQTQEDEVFLPWEPPSHAQTHPDLCGSEALRSRATWRCGTGWCGRQAGRFISRAGRHSCKGLLLHTQIPGRRRLWKRMDGYHPPCSEHPALLGGVTSLAQRAGLGPKSRLMSSARQISFQCCFVEGLPPKGLQ